MIGVYSISDPTNRETFYVGRGNDCKRRSKASANPGKRGGLKDQRIADILSAGMSPKIRILRFCFTKEESIIWEKYFIAKIGRKDLGLGPLLNQTDGGDGPTGLSIVTRQKMSEARKGEGNGFFGMHHSKESKAKIASAKIGGQAPNKGIPHSEEAKKKMSESLKGKGKGKKISEEQKSRISEANRGRHHTEEARKKMSEACKGRHRTAETRSKMSESRKGRPSPMLGKHHSAEARKRMSESHTGRIGPMLGKHHSSEAIKRMSESQKKRGV